MTNTEDQRNYKQFISRYEIVEELGRGGAAIVFRAFDPELGKVVAVKTLLPDQASPSQIMRFQLEAKALQNLRHHSIPQVYNFAVSVEDQRPYLVMEFIEGKSLEEILAETGGLSINEALSILNELCDVLAYAHSHGVIHRDIKPANIKVDRKRGISADVKLIDFGVAKVLATEEKQDLTKSGQLVGSPAYMSPEQIRGQEIDGRSDIYSLGCVAFQMLTGKLPFSGETAVETVMSHISTPAPGLATVCSERSFPDSVETIIAKCLAKKPEDRFQTMTDLKSALSVILHGDTIHGAFETRESNKRKSILAPVLIATALLIAGFTIYTTLNSDGSSRPLQSIPKIEEEYKEIIDFAESKKWNKTRMGTMEVYLAPPESDDTVLANLNEYPEAENIRILGNRHLTGEGFRYLKNKPLKYVQIATPSLSDAGLSSICQIGTLESLSIGLTSKVTEKSFAELPRLKNLRVIHLFVIRLPRSALSVLSKMNSLETIGIGSAETFDCEDLTLLKNLNKLKGLGLKNMRISDEACQKIAELKQVSILDLTNNPLGDAGAAALSSMNVTIMNLSRTDLGDKGLASLSKMKTLKNLTIVDCKRVSKEAIRDFHRTNHDCSLKTEGVEDEGMLLF